MFFHTRVDNSTHLSIICIDFSSGFGIFGTLEVVVAILGPYELNRIYTGDAKELALAIPDNSIDLIFTDPVYDRIDDYRWLAETAARVLKDDKACLAFCGIGYLPETLLAMSIQGLSYRWRLLIRPVYSKEFHGRLCVMTQECLWYEKGCSHLRRSLFEYNYSTHKGFYDVDGANWGKGLDTLLRYVEVFTEPDAIILDPFTGSGTVPAVCKMLGRNYLAFEIDPATAELARERVANTQPPLFVCEPEQLELEV